MPPEFAQKVTDIGVKQGFMGRLKNYVGVYQAEHAWGNFEALEDTGWEAFRFPDETRSSDICNVFPSNGIKMREFLEDLRDAGLAELLQNAAKPLGLPIGQDGSFSFTFAELGFIAVSYKVCSGGQQMESVKNTSIAITHRSDLH